MFDTVPKTSKTEMQTRELPIRRRAAARLKPVMKRVLRALPPAVQYHAFGRWRSPRTHEYLTGREAEAARASIQRLTETFRAFPDAPVIWFLPNQMWRSGSFQRPQQMARALVECGCNVLYLEEWHTNPMVRLPGCASLGKGEVQAIQDGLHIARLPHWLIAEMVGTLAPDILVLHWPEQADCIPRQARGSAPRVVYEVIDDPSLQPHADAAWHALHERWLGKADVVTVTADDLLRQVAPFRADALLLPNAVRLEDWRRPRVPPLPDDMAPARKAGTVIGYYGAFASWFDWEMWLGAARLRPEWSFVMIGYAYGAADEGLIRHALDISNVHYLGKKTNAELHGYLHHFDVAAIPFVLNDITHACSPVKLFEYLAGGKPVVSTPMREILKYESLSLAEDADSFVAQCEACLSAPRDALARALSRDAEANTWRSRADMLLDRLGLRPPRRP